MVSQRGLRPQPKFQISNSRSDGENDFSDGKSSRAARKFTSSSTASLARDLRVWPVRLFNRQSKGLTIFVCPNLQSAIFNRQSPILWGRLGNRPCDKRAPTKKSKKILDSPFC